MPYIRRIVDAEIADLLDAAGAIVIEGPKASGKTETARQVAQSSVLLDVDANARDAASADPDIVLEGPTPRLIDEWQEAPTIWNHIRRAVDDRAQPGQFLLTGSSTPTDDSTRHTGAGRFAFVRMRPMSLFEIGRSTGEISLGGLFADDSTQVANTGLEVADLASLLTIGGWPLNLGLDERGAARSNRAYLHQIRNVDVGRVAGGHRDPERVDRLLRSLARNTATEVALKVLAADAGGVRDRPLDWATANNYLDALERLLVIENQPAWAPHLRSKATLRQSPKRHFVDPSLAVAALGASPTQLRRDRNLFGLLFESLVIRDLRIYAQPLEGRVLHYRDSYGTEVDAIVQLTDGRWLACEVKLSPDAVDAAAASLLRLQNAVDLDKVGDPSALVVITGTGYGYRRPDGVAVVPIGALGP